MTREEAISILRNTAWLGSYEMTGKVEEAINIVAEALKAQPNLQPTCNELATDVISRQAAIELIERMKPYHQNADDIAEMIANMPSAQPKSEERTEESAQNVQKEDLISRKAAIDMAVSIPMFGRDVKMVAVGEIKNLPSAQPEQRYTEEELRVFQHGISLSLLSKRSAQYWQYDEDTATEIKFLERLYEKVSADMRGEQNED